MGEVDKKKNNNEYTFGKKFEFQELGWIESIHWKIIYGNMK